LLRRHALLAAARMPADQRLGVLLAARAVLEDRGDRWLATALEAAAAAHAHAFVAAAAPLATPPPAGEPRNLIPNPGFEQADPEDPTQPAGWRSRTYSGDTRYRWEREGGRSGACVVMDSAEGADSSWFQKVPVEPATRYRFSGWIRAERLLRIGDAHGALFNLHQRRYTVSERVTDACDWTEVAMEFATEPDEREIDVNCLLGGWGRARGLVRYDDLQLVRVGPANGLDELLAVARARLDAPETARAADAAATRALLEDGDAERGRRVFFEHEIAVCHRCHALDGRGGGIGPDLTGVGARLDRAAILESILDPNAKIAASWPAPVSAMPALRPFLSDQELAGLVAFLAGSR
jgi:mono/diheme cytochrome c family protein